MGIFKKNHGDQQKSSSSNNVDYTKIKTVYSFIASTKLLLDMNTPMGNAFVQQLHPYACQQIQLSKPEFKALYDKVEKENIQHLMGTGMANSSDHFTAALTDWLKSKGLNINDSNLKKKIFVFGGNAQNPQNGIAFEWSLSILFEFE